MAQKGEYYRLWEMQQGNFVRRAAEPEPTEAPEDDGDDVMSY